MKKALETSRGLGPSRGLDIRKISVPSRGSEDIPYCRYETAQLEASYSAHPADDTKLRSIEYTNIVELVFDVAKERSGFFRN